MDYIKRHLIYFKNIIINVFTKPDYTMDIVGECPICFEELGPIYKVALVKCRCKTRFYHKSCMYEWYSRNSTCPFCRANIKKKDII